MVIVGAGGAGLTAAIQATQDGADVIVLEMMPMVGGGSLKATGGMNAAVASGEDAEFGRNNGMDGDLATAPCYAIKIAPGIHHTMGGVKINTHCEVLAASGSPIPGLFAAGEVTGGVHGGNRIGGNAVCDFVVFGRVAGSAAAVFAGASK